MSTITVCRWSGRQWQAHVPAEHEQWCAAEQPLRRGAGGCSGWSQQRGGSSAGTGEPGMSSRCAAFACSEKDKLITSGAQRAGQNHQMQIMQLIMWSCAQLIRLGTHTQSPAEVAGCFGTCCHCECSPAPGPYTAATQHVHVRFMPCSYLYLFFTMYASPYLGHSSHTDVRDQEGAGRHPGSRVSQAG
jgi:hypothetical protein